MQIDCYRTPPFTYKSNMWLRKIEHAKAQLQKTGNNGL